LHRHNIEAVTVTLRNVSETSLQGYSKMSTSAKSAKNITEMFLELFNWCNISLFGFICNNAKAM